MKHRSLLSTVGATIASWFTPKATTTLSAAPLDAGTTATVPATIEPDTPFLIIHQEMTLAEFKRRYPDAPLG